MANVSGGGASGATQGAQAALSKANEAKANFQTMTQASDINTAAKIESDVNNASNSALGQAAGKVFQ